MRRRRQRDRSAGARARRRASTLDGPRAGGDTVAVARRRAGRPAARTSAGAAPPDAASAARLRSARVTRVKVCGITRPEDAELAVELGAWALGFILWPGSPRAADPAVAAGIAAALRRRVELVGVFVNPTLDEVAHAADALGLTHVQLHGDEGPSFCAEAGAPHGRQGDQGVPRSARRADFQDLERFHTDFHLLDTAARGLRGGTGETWDWALAARRRAQGAA